MQPTGASSDETNLGSTLGVHLAIATADLHPAKPQQHLLLPRGPSQPSTKYCLDYRSDSENEFCRQLANSPSCQISRTDVGEKMNVVSEDIMLNARGKKVDEAEVRLAGIRLCSSDVGTTQHQQRPQLFLHPSSEPQPPHDSLEPQQPATTSTSSPSSSSSSSIASSSSSSSILVNTEVEGGSFSVFPDEVMLYVLSWVPAKELGTSACLVCKKWNSFFREECLWAHIVQRADASATKPAQRSWQWIFRAKNIELPQRDPLFTGIAKKEDVTFTYYGEWKSGKHEGYGIQRFKSGAVYEGEFVAGSRKGKGFHTWADGDSYTGDWEKGQPHGQGTKMWPSGECYTGSWETGHRAGFGVYTWPTGHRYEGEWRDKAQEGRGKYSWRDGRVYDGVWKDGEKHGHGVYTWPNGCRYEGGWHKGHRQGEGVMTWEDGSRFEGRWENDRRTSSGKVYARDGQLVPSGYTWGTKTYDDYFDLDDEVWDAKYGSQHC